MTLQTERLGLTSPTRCELLETRLRRFRSRELACRSLPSTSRLATDLASRLAPMVVGYAGTVIWKFPENLPAIAIFAIATVSMLGSWFHDAVHKNTPIARPIARLVERIGSAPVGFSPRWWSYKHVRMHHRYVSNPEFDPDIQFGILGRVTAAQQWHPLHSMQYIHMWLLFPFATLNMLKPGELWTVRRFRRYKGIGTPPPGWIFLWDKYPPLVIVWLPVFLTHGFKVGLYCFLIFQAIAGTLVSIITQVQHNTTLADDSTDYSTRWPMCEQLARTTDVANSPSFWWWLSGGTNFHVAHHLIPTLSFLELPAVTARLKADLARADVLYPEHATIWHALRSHAHLVRVLAQRPI